MGLTAKCMVLVITVRQSQENCQCVQEVRENVEACTLGKTVYIVIKSRYHEHLNSTGWETGLTTVMELRPCS